MTGLNGPMIYFVMLIIAAVSFLLAAALSVVLRLLWPEIHAVYGEAIQTWLFFSALIALPLFVINLLLSERRIKKTEELLGGKLDTIDRKLDKLETMDKKLDTIDKKLDKLETMDKKLDKLDDISKILRDMRDTLNEINRKLK